MDATKYPNLAARAAVLVRIAEAELLLDDPNATTASRRAAQATIEDLRVQLQLFHSGPAIVKETAALEHDQRVARMLSDRLLADRLTRAPDLEAYEEAELDGDAPTMRLMQAQRGPAIDKQRRARDAERESLTNPRSPLTFAERAKAQPVRAEDPIARVIRGRAFGGGNNPTPPPQAA